MEIIEKAQREFILQELFVPDFIEIKGAKLLLVETEDTGKSELLVYLSSDKNLCIANVDKKKTDLHFFQPDKSKSMYKRVDHIIFEQKTDHTWRLHIIEMKGSVGGKKWQEIKGKFRASYLLSKAIAGMLDLTLSESIFYTTYEKVQFAPPDTMPTARRSRSGEPLVRMEKEWNGTCFSLQLGKRIPFLHKPIQMERNETATLTGKLYSTLSQST